MVFFYKALVNKNFCSLESTNTWTENDSVILVILRVIERYKEILQTSKAFIVEYRSIPS